MPSPPFNKRGKMSKEVTKPYIGVTGITTESDAQEIAQTFSSTLPKRSTHQGAVEYLVSSKTLQGVYEPNAKYPALAQLSRLLGITNQAALNAIHYRTTDRSTLPQQIKQLFTETEIYQDGLCRTLQLNLSWPDVDQLRQIRQELPGLKIILSLSGRILKRQPWAEISRRAWKYRDLADYVLIDPSGGRGIEFEDRYFPPYYRLINDILPDTPVVLAGGFDDRNVLRRIYNISRLLHTEAFGIDAETRLRVKKDRSDHFGEFSSKKAADYIKKAAAFFNR